jgi:hypothetical protein
MSTTSRLVWITTTNVQPLITKGGIKIMFPVNLRQVHTQHLIITPVWKDVPAESRSMDLRQLKISPSGHGEKGRRSGKGKIGEGGAYLLDFERIHN